MRRVRASSQRFTLIISLTTLLVALLCSDMLAGNVATAVDVTLCAATLAGIVVVTVLRRRRSVERLRTEGEPFLQGSVQLGLYLSPVILLTVAFPLATHRMAHATVGGAPLTSLLLAASLTVPWLSQIVCLPLYRGIADLVATGTREEIEERLCRVWPVTFLQSLASLIVFAVPVELVTHWSAGAMGAYVTLGVVYVAFSQSLIIGIVAKRRLLWAVGWALFAAALLLAPTLWFLPPLVGLTTQLVPLRHRLRAALHPVAMDGRDVARDLARGFLLGAVLWSDKLFYFYRDGARMPVVAVFVGLLPAILAYNYYFVRLAPTFDASVDSMRVAMERDSYRAMTATSRRLATVVEEDIARTGLSGAVLGLAVISGMGVVAPAEVSLVATVTAASWLFMMTTVLCYKLDYIGERRRAQAISAAHLAACALAFAVLPPGTVTYGALIAVEAVLFAVSLRRCIAAWTSSEYQLFWTHATAW